MAGSDPQQYVTLRGGLTVPLAPMLLVFDLQDRGFTLTAEGDEFLRVQPHDRLTRVDCEQIRRWKRHILALLSYDAPRVA